MTEYEPFDRIAYDEGDIVIRKFKEKGTKAETIVKSIMVDNVDDKKSYNIIFFESNPDDFHCAFEFEPYDKDEREEYYRVWAENPLEKKKKPKKKVEQKVKKVLTTNLRK